MAGGSKELNILTRELCSQLLERPCQVYGSDMKVRSSKEHYAHPGITVVGGEELFSDADKDVLLNPTLIVKVLSPTAEAWDRGGEFEQYRRRESLQEYVLIAQDRPHLERFAREPDGEWRWTERNGLEASLALPSIGCELALAEVYRKVPFPAEASGK